MFDRLRRVFARIGSLGSAGIGIALWEIGARVRLPGLNPDVLAEFLRTNGNVMLWLYDALASGALARGALLALGILPYLSARFWMRLARFAFPRLKQMWATRVGRGRLREWTRRLTLGLAALQAIGFTRFAIRADAGVSPIFVISTMVILTAGSVLAMLISEQVSQPSDSDLPVEDGEPDAAPATPELLSAGTARAEPIHAARPEPVRTRE